jgi:hypothetical protein
MNNKVKMYKEKYPIGTRLEIINMEDAQAVPSGTKGSVVCVDDMGTIHMKWDNGRTLGLIPGVDSFKKIEEV